MPEPSFFTLTFLNKMINTLQLGRGLAIGLLSLLPTLTHAQSWQWGLQSVNALPNPDRVDASGVSTDGAGQVYVAGTLYPDPIMRQPATRSFGATSITTHPGGGSSGYVAQASPSGQWTWAQELRPVPAPGDNGAVEVSDVVATATGEIYVAGYARASSLQVGSFNQPLASGPFVPGNTFVARFSSTGICQWVRTLTNQSLGLLPRLAWNPATNGLVLAAISSGTFSVGSTTLSDNSLSRPFLYLAHLSAAGQWLGADQATGTGLHSITQLAVGTQGQVAVAGLWGGGSLQFGPSTLTAPAGGSRSQCFLAQLSAARQWQWALGGSGYVDSQFFGLAYPATGSLWVAGYGPTGTALGSLVLAAPGLRYVGFAGQLSAAGQWTTGYQLSPQGSGSTMLGSLALDLAGSLVLAGLVTSPTAGPTIATLGNTTILAAAGQATNFITRLTPTGQWQYAVPLSQPTGSNALLGFRAATLDHGGNFYLSGSLRGNLTVGSSSLSSPTTSLGSDALLLKLGNAGALAIHHALPPPPAALVLWPNPAHQLVHLRWQGPTSAPGLQLLDAQGRRVRQQLLPANATSAMLDVTGLAPGLYLLRCGAATSKLIVE
jgi:hypothetical protein